MRYYTLSSTSLCCLCMAWILSEAADYAPILSWDVCSPSRIIVTLSGGADGGIIYIKGYGAACRQATYNVSTSHEFEFDSCGIVAETYFTIIVQKNPLYQKGADLQESLLCIYDLSDITVGNGVSIGDKDDDSGLNKTVKPTAQMKLYKEGKYISGSDVKLTDRVFMTIQLDDEFIEDFDLKAISCTANFLDIVHDSCASDEDLFPNFVHATQGAITASFGAFRTTDLSSGYVNMIFSCTLQVCRGLCSPATCSGEAEGWGRKKRATENVAYDDMNVGASLSVGTDVDITVTSEPRPDNNFCMNNLAFIIGLMVILAILMMSMGLTSYVTSRLAKKTDQLRKLSGSCVHQTNTMDKMNMDTSRRKSSVCVIQTNSVTGGPISIKSDNSCVRTIQKENADAEFNKQEQDLEKENPALRKQISVSVMYNPASTNGQTSQTSHPIYKPITGTGSDTRNTIRNTTLNNQDNQSVLHNSESNTNSTQSSQISVNLSMMNKEQIKQAIANLTAQKQILQYKALLSQMGSSPMPPRRH